MKEPLYRHVWLTTQSLFMLSKTAHLFVCRSARTRSRRDFLDFFSFAPVPEVSESCGEAKESPVKNCPPIRDLS